MARLIDGDGHLLESWGTNFIDYFEEPYRSRTYEFNASIGREGTPFPAIVRDGWDRNLGAKLYSGRGNTREAWLEALEVGGLDAAVLFPTDSLALGNELDPDFGAAWSRAYNRWVVAEVMKGTDGPLYGSALLYPHDPATAVEELRYAKEHGLVAAMFPADGDHRLGHAMYDPVYEEAQRLDIPIVAHAGGTQLGNKPFPKFIQSHTYNHPAANIAQFTSVMFEGVPARFPDLRMAFLEIGASWAPWYLDRMDEEWEKRGPEEAPKLPRKPSSYVHAEGNIYFGLEADERLLSATLDLVGPRSVMYASDWPHWDGEYPHSLKQIQEHPDLDDEKREGVLGAAAARFYKI